MRNSKDPWILLLLFVVALVLRLTGTSFGLPEIYHSDEPHEVYRALRLGAGSVDLSAYRAMKGGYFYLLFIEYGVYFSLLSLFGLVEGVRDFALRFAADPSAIWLISRCTTAVLGAATVPALYFLGRKMFPQSPAALFAAAFLTFSFRHIVDSHYATVDVPMTFFLVVGFLALFRMMKRGGLRDYLAAGLLMSYAAQFKIVLAAVMFPFIIAHLLSGAGMQEAAGRRRRRFLIASLAAIIFYLAGNPGILFNMREILSYLSGSLGGGAAPKGFAVTMAHKEFLGFRLYLSSFFGGSGLLIPVFTAGGLILAAKRRDPSDLLVLSFLVPTAAVLFSSRTGAAPRYMIPLLPFFFLYAGAFLADSLKWLGFNRPKRRGVAVILLLATALTMFPPLQRSVAFDREMKLPDTRTIARGRIIESIPRGSRILIAGKTTFPAAGTVNIPITRRYIEERIMDLEKTDSGRADFLRNYFLATVVEGSGFEPVYFDSSDETFDLDGIWPLEPEYAVVSSRVSRKFLKDLGRKNNPDFAAFYDRIFTNRLIMETRPSPGISRGPEVRVYLLDSSMISTD